MEVIRQVFEHLAEMICGRERSALVSSGYWLKRKGCAEVQGGKERSFQGATQST